MVSDDNPLGLEVFVLTMEDTIVQTRDYVVMATDENDAKTRVADGYWIAEGAPETIDHAGESRVVEIAKVTGNHEG